MKQPFSHNIVKPDADTKLYGYKADDLKDREFLVSDIKAQMLPQESALTAEDNSTVDGTYGTEEANVIQNLRTRVGELETKLQNLGLIA